MKLNGLFISMFMLCSALYATDAMAKRVAPTEAQTSHDRAAQKNLENDIAAVIAQLESMKRALKDTQKNIERKNQMPLPANCSKRMGALIANAVSHLDQAQNIITTVAQKSTIKI